MPSLVLYMLWIPYQFESFSIIMTILWCSQINNHPQEDLSNFGYRPNIQLIFNIKTYCKNLVVFKKNQNLVNLGHFFHNNPLHGWNCFLDAQIWKSTKRKKLCWRFFWKVSRIIEYAKMKRIWILELITIAYDEVT